MKAEVYSWRVSRETKMALEQEARGAGVTLAALLERMAAEWLQKKDPPDGDEQKRLHEAASAAIGSISGGQRRRAESARETVRTRLRRQHGR